VNVIWSREETSSTICTGRTLRRISAGPRCERDARRLDAPRGPAPRSTRGTRRLYFRTASIIDAIECAAQTPYDLPAVHIDYVRVEPVGIQTAFWRGVGPVKNVFIVESFVDELAHAARQDPVAYRRALLTKNPRALAVLNLAN